MAAILAVLSVPASCVIAMASLRDVTTEGSFSNARRASKIGQISSILSHAQLGYSGSATLRIGPGNRKDIEGILHRLPELCRRFYRSRFMSLDWTSIIDPRRFAVRP